MLTFNRLSYIYFVHRLSKNLGYFRIILLTSMISNVAFLQTIYAESRLLMITDPACPFCQAWEKEIGPVYPKTDIAKSFPLFRVSITDTTEAFSKTIKSVSGTPTFIFLENETEIGRIEGFSDAEMFWWLVEDIVLDSNISSE